MMTGGEGRRDAVSNLARQSISSRHGAQGELEILEKAIGRNRNG